MATLGKFKTTQQPWTAECTELNHLGAMLAAKPHVFEKAVTKMFSAQNYFSDNPMMATLVNIGATEQISSMEYEWKLKGADSIPAVVIENVEPAIVKQPGLGRTTFKIKVDQKWFKVGSVISPGNQGHTYQSRIIDDGQPHGTGFVYTARLVNDDPKAFLPLVYLQPGQQWIQLFGTYGEGAEKGVTTSFSAPFTLRGSIGKLRREYKMTDYALEQVLATPFVDRTGKAHKFWLSVQEAESMRAFERDKEIALWYNRKANSLIDSTGRKVDSFAGINEQLEDAHNHYYSELTAKLIEDFLMDIFYSRVKPGAGRKIKAYTGEYGMLLFHRAMNDLMTKRGWIMAGTNFNPVKQTSSEYNSNAYSVGYQFTKYIMHNGAELELIHNPIQDDRSINFELDPVTGYPVESMVINFLDFGGEGTASNIKLVEKKDGYKFGYVNGLVGPYGATKGGAMAHSGEYFEMHYSKEFGVKIHDITRCGRLVYRKNMGV